MVEGGVLGLAPAGQGLASGQGALGTLIDGALQAGTQGGWVGGWGYKQKGRGQLG